MTDLQMTLVHDKVNAIPPEDTLLVIRNTIRILKDIEKNISGKKRAKIIWRFNVFSVFGQTIIQFQAASNTELTRQIAERMNGVDVDPDNKVQPAKGEL